MIDKIFKELNSTSFDKDENGEITLLSWQEITNYFAWEMRLLGSMITSCLAPLVGKQFLNHSIEECLVTRKPSGSIAEYRIRPKKDYYIANDREIPAPENPNGKHATGLGISVILYNGISNYSKFISPQIVIEFQIWGIDERLSFGHFLSDYRRLIEKLLYNTKYEFFTPVSFKNVDSHRRKDIFSKLELYYENVHDAENSFTISTGLREKSDISDAVKAIIPLFILYECALGYSQKRKNKDKILNYLHFIK